MEIEEVIVEKMDVPLILRKRDDLLVVRFGTSDEFCVHTIFYKEIEIRDC